MNVLLILSVIGMVYCLFMLIRNRIVYNIRTDILNGDYSSYKLLPSYDKMMYQWSMWTKQSYLNRYAAGEEDND